MKLIYFDESKNDDQYAHYHMGGVCIDEKDLIDIEKRVANIAERAFGSSELTRETELHAAEVWQGSKHFKKWREDLGKRLGLLSDFIDIRHPHLTRLLRCLDQIQELSRRVV